MNTESNKNTPVIEQYLEIKKQFKDFIVLFRLGDFFEMFFEDAIFASKVLNIILTKRCKNKDNPVPMCGIPLHNYPHYVKKLIWAGKNVAICDQIQTPEEAKNEGRSIVRREVTKIITKSNISYELREDETETNYILSLNIEKNEFYGFFFDITTGEFFQYKNENKYMSSFLERINPTEILFAGNDDLIPLQWSDRVQQIKIVENPSNDYKHLSRFFIDLCDEYKLCFEIIWWYLEYIRAPIPSSEPMVFVTNEKMFLSDSSIRKLNLIDHHLGTDHTLFGVLNYTGTPIGKRILKREILSPLTNVDKINDRLNLVEIIIREFIKKNVVLSWPQVDLQKIFRRMQNGHGNLEDFFNYIKETKKSESIIDAIQSKIKSNFFQFKLNMNFTNHLSNKVFLSDESGMLCLHESVSEDLFRAEEKRKDLLGQLNFLHQSYVEKTGINTLKIRNNDLVGFFIEIPLAQKSKIESRTDFIFKQSLINSYRYTTNDLVILEKDLQQSEKEVSEHKKNAVKLLIQELVNKKEYYDELNNLLGFADFVFSMAQASFLHGYTKPVINNSFNLIIEEGRHAVVERKIKDFIPNNTNMEISYPIAIVTGPNMGGKSTYLKQVALIVLLSHMGCFVPAKSAEIGLCNSIFTRIGAEDDISTNQSTFMLEMNELSFILKTFSPRSLLVLDEIGRGTSLQCGISLSVALILYFAETNPCRCFFSTHFHELKLINSQFIRFLRTAYVIHRDGIILLHKIEEGIGEGSFGINVAKIAKIPEEIIEKAELISKKMKITVNLDFESV